MGIVYNNTENMSKRRYAMRPFDTGSARRWAEEIHASLLEEGDRVIDATMGNGHDTLRLCRLVGNTGKVYAFDVQPEALISTRARLEEAGESVQAELILDGHQNVKAYVTEPVNCAVFNLGWLPGIEHAVTTLVSTTIPAVNACLELLAPGGVLTVCVYPGHEEGAREKQALIEWARALDPALYDCVIRSYMNQPGEPPLLIAVRKAEKIRRKQKRPV